MAALQMVTAPPAQLESVAPAAVTSSNRVRQAFSYPNVIGVGIAEKVSREKPTGVLAVTFYVEKKKDLDDCKPAEILPSAVVVPDDPNQAVPADVVELGKLRLEVTLPHVKRRPIQPGFSVGHVKSTAGTLGAIVTTRTGERYILSNSHVLALGGLAKPGDKVLFPGPLDQGAEPDDVIAELAAFQELVPGGQFVNRVDAALATVHPDRVTEVKENIYRMGLPKGTIAPSRGMRVVKVGRTTGRTTGIVRDVHFNFSIEYEGVGQVGFTEQVLCTKYSDGGDSGSLVIDRDTGKAVGLHFAGADGGSVFNPIQEVLQALDVKLVTAGRTGR